jgi:probable HAF family extracellular repeat protein
MLDLGTLPGSASSEAVAINRRGQVIGNSPAATLSFHSHAFLWQNGRIIRLDTPAVDFRKAVAINERGQVLVNTFLRSPDSQERAYVWQNGRMTDLGTLGGRKSEAIAINDRGEIIGWSDVAGGPGLSRVFLWQNGQMTDLGDTFFPSLLTSSGALVGEVAVLPDEGVLLAGGWSDS